MYFFLKKEKKKLGESRERLTGTWAIGTGELETLFLDDEAGANESAGKHGQHKPRQIAGAHLSTVFSRYIHQIHITIETLE